MVDITLLEMHLHGDTQFGPESIPGPELGESAEETTPEETEAEESSAVMAALGSAVAAMLVGFLAIRVLRRLFGEEETEGERIEVQSDEPEAAAD